MLQPCKFAIYKQIKGYPNYWVNSLGEVSNVKTGNLLAYSRTKPGYTSVRLCQDNVYGSGVVHHKRFLLHRLVLSSFTGFDLQKKYVDHKDDNPANNELANLRWVTQSENIKKSYDLGRSKTPKAGTGKFGKLHSRSIGVIGYKDGAEVVRYESINLANKQGYTLNFYRGNKYEAISKGITFKKDIKCQT